MKTTNRGNIPAPHIPLGQSKVTVDPAEEVVFDPGELSFVQDWVEGADGQELPTVDDERSVRGQSGQNRRLGVGAVAKKSSRERVRDCLRLAVIRTLSQQYTSLGLCFVQRVTIRIKILN